MEYMSYRYYLDYRLSVEFVLLYKGHRKLLGMFRIPQIYVLAKFPYEPYVDENLIHGLTFF